MVDLGKRRVRSSLFDLIRYLRKERPDVVLSAMDHANMMAIWAKYLSGAKTRIVVSIHNNMSRVVENTRNRRDKLRPFLSRYFYPKVDAVIAVSNGVANDIVKLTGLSWDSINVIYNPVVTPELFEMAREPVNYPWFKSGKPPVILGVGRLTMQKDFSILIRAFALVRKKMPARLMILGEGEERPKLEAVVRELNLGNDVALPGFVENPYKYIKRAAVFVLSSRWEGFGNVLVEALALGTPVVSTDCPSGPREILEGGKWGCLVPVGNVEAMAQSIQAALEEGVPIEVPLDSYNLDNVVNKYLEILGISPKSLNDSIR